MTWKRDASPLEQIMNYIHEAITARAKQGRKALSLSHDPVTGAPNVGMRERSAPKALPSKAAGLLSDRDSYCNCSAAKSLAQLGESDQHASTCTVLSRSNNPDAAAVAKILATVAKILATLLRVQSTAIKTIIQLFVINALSTYLCIFGPNKSNVDWQGKWYLLKCYTYTNDYSQRP